MTPVEQSSLTSLPARPEISGGWHGWLLGIIATVGFSLATPISRYVILQGTDPSVVLILRLGLATILMGVTWLFYRPASLNFGWRSLAIVGVLGFLSGISTLAYNWSLTMLDASMAVMIFAINPVVALSILWLGGERMTRRQVVRLTLALLGVYLLIGPGGTVSWLGTGLVLLSMVSWSIQMVGVQWYLRDKDSGAIAFYIAASSALVVIGYWWTQGEQFHVPNLQLWLLIILQVIVATYIARLCFFSAIQKIGSGQMSLLMPVETLLAVILSMIFLGERIAWLQMGGALLILTSAILAFERLTRLRVPGKWKAVVPLE